MNGEPAELYAGKQQKTITRDLNALVRLKLIRRRPSGYVSNIKVLEAFLPPPAQTD